jgi:myo-inositol 2-dehydrogenase/D-chiro-inositol 1-dehydrogenase
MEASWSTCYRRAGDVDTAISLLKFSNGAICTISNSRQASYGYDQRLELLGSAGAISMKRCEYRYHRDGRSVRRDLPLRFLVERYTESFVSEMAAFVDAVHHDTPVPVTGLDGRAPVVMALAAGKSLAESRPVRLSEIVNEQGMQS